MAGQWYDQGLNGLGTAEIDLDTATVKAVLLRGAVFGAGHKFLSDVVTAGATIVATTPALTSKTVGAVGVGVLDAADTAWASVPTGAACNAYVLVQSSAVTGGADVATTAQRVISWHDDAAGLPVTPNGANISLAFNAAGIIKW